MNVPKRALTAVLLAVVTMPAAIAHVTLEQPRATAGSYHKVVMRVGHACNGARFTTAITARLPAGLRGAKPMPKAGWTLTTVRAALAQPYDNHGRRVTEDVVEVRWQASTAEHALASDHYDEFVLRGQLPATAGPLWFKVLQTCDVGTVDWADLPATGISTRGMATPAVLLEVMPAEGGGHRH